MKALCAALIVICLSRKAIADDDLNTFKQAIQKNDLAAAQLTLNKIEKNIGNDPASRFNVIYNQATLFVYQGDYEAASKLLINSLAEAENHTELQWEFWFHNSLIILRTAQGDLTSALLECDAMTRAGQHATWSASGEGREIFVALKDAWHRAYLQHLLAQTLTGSRRQAAKRYAETEHQRYILLASKAHGYEDSVAVLDGIFAALGGDKAKALAAAQRVNIAENSDFEDLYLAAIAFQFGGDPASARKIRAKMHQSDAVYLARPIMTRWLDHALGLWPGSAKTWTPHTLIK